MTNESPHRLSLSLPAVPLQFLGFVSAVKKLPLEELHGNDGKDEHEEHVDNQDVQDVLQGVHHTVKHSLRRERTGHGRGVSPQQRRSKVELSGVVGRG